MDGSDNVCTTTVSSTPRAISTDSGDDAGVGGFAGVGDRDGTVGVSGDFGGRGGGCGGELGGAAAGGCCSNAATS